MSKDTNEIGTRGLVVDWAPPVVWGAVIALLLLLPGSSFNSFSLDIPYADKFVHAILFLVFSALLLRAFVHTGTGTPAHGRAVTASCIISLCYGIITELLQSYVPGRSSDICDALADMIGVMVFSAVYIGLKAAARRSSRRDK